MSNMRQILATALSDEIMNLLEDAEDDDQEFDKLLADIDTRIQEYRI
jgi:hypothetical protein